MHTACSVPHQERTNKGGKTPESSSYRIRLAKKGLALPLKTKTQVLIIEGGPATAVVSSNVTVGGAKLSLTAENQKVEITSGTIGGEAII